MRFEGEYEPSPAAYAAEQVAAYEASAGSQANTAPGTEYPIVIVTYRGAKSGKIRKTPLMRVESDGHYALVGSNAASDRHPAWYGSVLAAPTILIQDGPEPRAYSVRELSGSEREHWWERAVDAYPIYADYRTETERVIPVLLADPIADPSA